MTSSPSVLGTFQGSTLEIWHPGKPEMVAHRPGGACSQRAGSGLPPTLTLMTFSPLFSPPCPPLLCFLPWSPSVSLAVPLATPPQVFLTATHSHSSPFDALEGYICPVLFGSACGGDHHHDNHGGSHSGGGPGAQHSAMPAKSKEELSEGSRKKKAKKAD